ncbi:myomesin-3 [Spea bombifrons]|uniref:myomesin-3 n=1 Tax=Spea bombifrons TaxID=233779 RepID=UPI00234B0B36|nr:myomesin-3 [Spea bombifrons]XP_053310774.1 myomesin-3 [Spea bombifrons]
MERRSTFYESQEEETEQKKQMLQMGTTTMKRKFRTSDEELDDIPVSSIDLSVARAEQVLRPTWNTIRHDPREFWVETRDWSHGSFRKYMDKLEVNVIQACRSLRERVDRKALRRKAEEKCRQMKEFRELCGRRAPMFWVPLRAHCVWERMSVTLVCTVLGNPKPLIQWFKNGEPIDLRSSPPGKYRILNEYGMLTLEIRRCSLEDSADYSVVATNTFGQATSFANVLVRQYVGMKSGWDSVSYPALLPVYEGEFTSVLKPVFARENEAFTLSCSVSSSLERHGPSVHWFRDGELLKDSARRRTTCLGNEVSLSGSPVYKEDEGLYTVSVPAPSGHQEQSAYLFVRDAEPEALGAPGSPLCVRCHDIHKDCLLLSWAPPSNDRGSSVHGYYVERCDVSSDQWIQCNEVPTKICRFPVSGLIEGKTYLFRVKAVNQAGVSLPSKASEPVTMRDSAKEERAIEIPYDEGRKIIVSKDDLIEEPVKVPSPPSNVHAGEVSEDYIVLCWDEPEPHGKEPLSYYVEKSIAGSNKWQRINLETPVNSPRLAVFELDKGKSYCFRVQAINKHGASDHSKPSEPISLGATLVVPPAPDHMMALRDTNTSVVVQWGKVECDPEILGYYIYSRVSGDADWQPVNNKPLKGTRFTVPELETGKDYEFSVRAVNEAGLGERSPVSDPININQAIYCPSAPYDFVLLSCGKDEMTIGWKAPKFTAGREVLGYYLDQHDSSELTWKDVRSEPIPKRTCKVTDLHEGHFYEFRARAMNSAGVGKMSEPSDLFKCEEWTMAVPGPPYDVRCTEVRNTSLMLHWEPPVYEGCSSVTGYFIEMQEEGSDTWKKINESPTSDTHLRISDLETGKQYQFRVIPINSAGTGSPSLPCDPVIAATKPGTNEIEVGVDDEGVIFLSFENPEPIDNPQFIWSKNYKGAPDPERTEISTEGNKSKLVLTNPSADDLGTYSVEVLNTDGVSASHTLTEEELADLLKKSHDVQHPLIRLISGWNKEVLENGDVRLWLQVEKLSPAADLEMILNDKIINNTPKRKINFDKENGLIEIIKEDFGTEDKGTYTAKVADGKASNQFSLILTGEEFDQILDESNQKKNMWKKKKGPHFLEQLQWKVTEDCHVIIICKVTNITKETTLKWSMDKKSLSKGQYDSQSGDGKLTIEKFTNEDKGNYKAVVKDSRGEDVSDLDLCKEGFENIMKEICKISALSASPLKCQGTSEGIKIYSDVKYFTESMNPTWHHKNKKLDSTDRVKSGSTMNQVWLHIINPTDADKGLYVLELFDGKDIHKRTLDLSGKAFDDAMAEHLKFKEAAITEKNRAKVVRGLPDLATIMEDKTLCLTCHISGDPSPEITWIKNERKVVFKDRYKLDVKGTVVTITIDKICAEDSGRYSITVKNKYGSETGQVTVSVFKHGEEPEELKKTMGKPQKQK